MTKQEAAAALERCKRSEALLAQGSNLLTVGTHRLAEHLTAALNDRARLIEALRPFAKAWQEYNGIDSVTQLMWVGHPPSKNNKAAYELLIELGELE